MAPQGAFQKALDQQLANLMASLRKGDVVLVILGRFSRSTRELLDLIHRIGQAGASFKSLGHPLFDTTSSQGRLLVTMLAAIAEFERELQPFPQIDVATVQRRRHGGKSKP